ncbi:MAG: cupin domain-containing protein [Gemmobacter sp.]
MRLGGMGLALEDLHGGFDAGVLEARLGRLDPGARSGDEPMAHPGEEVCHVLDGAIRYRIAGAVHRLGPGNTIHFHATEPHHWENAAEGPTRVVWVFSDGLSF